MTQPRADNEGVEGDRAGNDDRLELAIQNMFAVGLALRRAGRLAEGSVNADIQFALEHLEEVMAILTSVQIGQGDRPKGRMAPGQE